MAYWDFGRLRCLIGGYGLGLMVGKQRVLVFLLWAVSVVIH